MSLSQQATPAKRWRIISIYGGGLTALVVLFFVSLCYGEAALSLHDVWSALTNRQDTLEHNMIWDLRMPRTVIGILAGGALAVAGALLQTITRNPLAASDTLGINAGAYFIVVLGAILFPGVLSKSPFLFAAVGGLFAAFAAYFMGGGRTSTPVRLALSGMIVSMVLGSFTSALHIFFSMETQGLFLWGSGTLVQNDWTGVNYAWPLVTGVTLLALILSKQWDMLELDESTASSLGQRVGLARTGGLIIAVVLAAVIVSVIGPIGFVGLVAPHLVRLSGVRSNRLLIPGVFVWGAALLVGADVLAKMIHNSSMELPTGAVMAIIGAPWLIWLVLTRMKAGNGAGMTTSMSTGGRVRRFAFVPMAILFSIITIVLVLLSTMFGGMRIPLADLLPSLFQSDGMFSALIQLRIPRTLVAAGAGAALAISGVLIQMAVRNPLADASIVGVSSGAGLGAMMVFILWPELPMYLLPIAAIVGAAIAATLVFSLSWKKGLNPSAVVLLGIAMSAIAGAGIQILIVRGAVYGSSGYIWLTGSTYARTWDQVKVIGIFLLILVPVAWWLARRFELLVFDDNSASGLGMNVRRTRLLAMTVGVLLAAGAVACVGTVGFIGLIAPHMVRLLTGHKLRQSMFLSALAGAVMLVLADTIGRTVMAPTEIPSGILIALIGTPYFLYLMYRSSWRKAMK